MESKKIKAMEVVHTERERGEIVASIIDNINNTDTN